MMGLRAPKRRTNPTRVDESRRERGIIASSRWQTMSLAYRRENPLCVFHLFRGEVVPAEVVDHIAPRNSLPDQEWDPDNFCSLCVQCHNWKTTQEPKAPWLARPDRLVICGLPAVGKTTHARGLGWPCFDADAHPLAHGVKEVEAARNAWIGSHGPADAMVVIVSHPLAASKVAQQIGSCVMHVTLGESERHARLAARKAAGLAG